MTASDLYADVTNRIVAALEKGGLPPWRKPWASSGGFLPLRHNGQPYRGVNVVILWIEGESKGYASPHWLTFKQAKEYGGAVKAGEKSTPILFCQPMTKKETADDGAESEARYWMSKVYRVFNAQQCHGLPDQFTPAPAAPQLDPSQRVEQADAFLKNLGATISYGGEAYYNPALDYISLPHFEAFATAEAFYGTALHEAGHWTGHAGRLGRPLSQKREEYAREEIVAELASCLVSAQLGIAPPSLDQHAAYLDFWIQAMKADARYLFTAAAAAQKAADYLNALQPQPE